VSSGNADVKSVMAAVAKADAPRACRIRKTIARTKYVTSIDLSVGSGTGRYSSRPNAIRNIPHVI